MQVLVTALSEKGIPTPLAATMLSAPESRMDILSPPEIASINSSSDLVRKYGQVLDREIRTPSRTTYGRSSRSPQNEVVKVLTSATFIRGVFGILKKVMR